MGFKCVVEVKKSSRQEKYLQPENSGGGTSLSNDKIQDVTWLVGGWWSEVKASGIEVSFVRQTVRWVANVAVWAS